MSTEEHATRIKAFVTTLTKRPTFEHDEAQARIKAGTLPDEYVVIYVSRRGGTIPRLDGIGSSPLRRLQTRVSAVDHDNAVLVADRIAEGFEFATVTLDDDGDSIAHFTFESGDSSFELDEGYYTALTTWTFAV